MSVSVSSSGKLAVINAARLSHVQNPSKRAGLVILLQVQGDLSRELVHALKVLLHQCPDVIETFPWNFASALQASQVAVHAALNASHVHVLLLVFHVGCAWACAQRLQDMLGLLVRHQRQKSAEQLAKQCTFYMHIGKPKPIGCFKMLQ